MAHGLSSVIKRAAVQCKPEGKTGVGSRRIFSPQFKLQVLDSYRNDTDCKGNQRATARKYGIHRRQIQKWLQVENTLRNGVSGKPQQMALNGHRQRDDDQRHRSASLAASTTEEARVPTLEPPTGWRQHHQQAPTTCMVPIDLSLKKQPLTPTPPPTATVHLHLEPSPSPENRLGLHPDVWDLSTKPATEKRKLEHDDNPNKKVKLFKPYLLDDIKQEPDQKSPSSPQMYCCQPSPEIYFNNNNIEYHPAYTLHELQPKTFYPCYPYYTNEYPNLSPTYHPSYSLDFKFDCYYQDSLCKGNPRAVLTKYNNILRSEIKSEKDIQNVR
ncbi:unnamed protein product [Ceutorhynchus assimilis]|uniref:Brinker DNA-binding domain-containing protein n=1 Tax=Ceutorhynchus assimilis TaxID=467358 RepID=A0A9N9QJF3_9CUCU|nr:unnamed protein product [Ceutorhynchus assimilis]